jgi:hypothetical protein
LAEKADLHPNYLGRVERGEEYISVTAASHASTFPEPNPTVESLTTARNNLSTRLTTIGTMEANLESERAGAVTSEKDLDALIVQLASYIENIAKGDLSILQMSGFAISTGRSAVGPLSAPENLQGFMADIEGQVKLKWNRVRGAKTYIVECATSPEGPWTQIDVTTRATCKATGLTSGTKYWFRLRAVGAAGLSGWSDPAQKMAA